MDDEILETKPLSRRRRDARFSSFTSVQRKSAHAPVLLQEVLRWLAPAPGAFVVDGTVNGGGHAREILKRIGPHGSLLGIDWDGGLIENLAQEFRSRKNVTLIRGNYADLPEMLRAHRLPRADGLLLDLGFSSEQLESGRGFSFLRNEPLRMTYDESREPVRDILRKIREEELASVIREFGQERFARRIAHSIKGQGHRRPIATTGELREAIIKAVPKNYERGRIDPATRTFQALRMYANAELENLEKILRRLPDVLKKGGRAAIVSFHSLEDGMVKRALRRLETEGSLEILTKKPIGASPEEIERNPRSRSGKLRVIERT